jgi:hypothetical protein
MREIREFSAGILTEVGAAPLSAERAHEQPEILTGK